MVIVFNMAKIFAKIYLLWITYIRQALFCVPTDHFFSADGKKTDIDGNWQGEHGGGEIAEKRLCENGNKFMLLGRIG